MYKNAFIEFLEMKNWLNYKGKHKILLKLKIKKIFIWQFYLNNFIQENSKNICLFQLFYYLQVWPLFYRQHVLHFLIFFCIIVVHVFQIQIIRKTSIKIINIHNITIIGIYKINNNIPIQNYNKKGNSITKLQNN